MRLFRIVTAALGCATACVLSVSVGFAQEGKLPDGLRHVPPDALGFIHIRVGDFRDTEAGKLLMAELLKDRDAASGLKEIQRTLGIGIADVETVTVVFLTPPPGMPNRWNAVPGRPIYDKKAAFDIPVMKEKRVFEEKKVEEKKAPPPPKDAPVVFQEFVGHKVVQADTDHQHDVMAYEEVNRMAGPLVIVTSARPLDRKKILKAQLFAGGPNNPHSGSSGMSVLFLGDRTVMVGAAWDLGRYSESMARKPGPKTTPLRSALALGAKPHLIVAGGQVPVEIRRMLFNPFNMDFRVLAPIAPLFQTEAGLTLDLGKSLELNLQFNAPTAASAENALEAAKTLRVLAELALEKSQEAGEAGGWKLDLEKGIAMGLKQAVFQKNDKTVTAQFKMDVTSKLVKHFTKELVANFRIKGDRTRSINNLKQIALAMHGFHDANKRLPAAGIHAINDPNGKPLLSWRVAILPYIDQGALYRQFDLTQPWDHPANKKLIAKMPAIYVVPGTDNKPGETNYRVLVGPGTMFELTPGNRGFSLVQIPDGTSNTIMAVEAAQPTIWTRPDDLPYDPTGPLPKFGTASDGFHVAMGDGTVRFLRANTPQQTLRALITRNGGEVFEFPFDR